MKKHFVKLAAILFVLALFTAACSLKAQSNSGIPAASIQGAVKPANAIVNESGNYTSVPSKPNFTDTGKTYTDLTTNKVHAVLKAYPSGKLFYFRTSKQTGKEYRCYLITNL